MNSVFYSLILPMYTTVTHNSSVYILGPEIVTFGTHAARTQGGLAVLDVRAHAGFGVSPACHLFLNHTPPRTSPGQHTAGHVIHRM